MTEFHHLAAHHRVKRQTANGLATIPCRSLASLSAEAAAVASRASPNKGNPGYVVLSDPSDLYETGVMFSQENFEMTLHMRHWPLGMRFRCPDGRRVTVVEGQLIRHLQKRAHELQYDEEGDACSSAKSA